MAQCDSVQRASSILLNMRLEKSLRDLLKTSTSAHPHLSSVSSSHIRMLGHSGPRNEDFLETCVTVNPTILLPWWFTLTIDLHLAIISSPNPLIFALLQILVTKDQCKKVT